MVTCFTMIFNTGLCLQGDYPRAMLDLWAANRGNCPFSNAVDFLPVLPQLHHEVGKTSGESLQGMNRLLSESTPPWGPEVCECLSFEILIASMMSIW